MCDRNGAARALNARQRELVEAAMKDYRMIVPALEDDSRVLEALMALPPSSVPGMLVQVPDLRFLVDFEVWHIHEHVPLISGLATREGDAMADFLKYGREACLRMAARGLVGEAGRVRALGHVLGDRDMADMADALEAIDVEGATADDIVGWCDRLSGLVGRAATAMRDATRMIRWGEEG